MVRTAIVDDNLEKYLSAVSRDNNYAVGLILGQSCLGKDYIIHFAKTPPLQTDDDKKSGKSAEKPKKIEDFNNVWLADHARQATRMLPGGFYVLGIFVISPDDVLNPFNPKIKSLLHSVHIQLSSNKYLFGSPNTDKLVLHHSSKTQKYFCKSYDVTSHSVQPVDVKSQPKNWINIHCDFTLNKLYYLAKHQGELPLEKHIKVILDELSGILDTAVFLYDREFRDKDDSLETLGKKKNRNSRSSKNSHESGDGQKPLQVSIFQSMNSNSSTNSDVNILDSGGRFRLIGKVASKLWMQPKTTIAEASEAVKEDILRSLTSRLEMHWDSLIEEENSEDINSVHEPPRRVLIALPDSEIALSDYLFPGEGPQEAKVSLEELLDVKINGKLNITDVEGQADATDLDKYYKGALDSDKDDVSLKDKPDSNHLMYMGLVLSLLVLIVAVLFKVFM